MKRISQYRAIQTTFIHLERGGEDLHIQFLLSREACVQSMPAFTHVVRLARDVSVKQVSSLAERQRGWRRLP